jgi:hypothetical protein
MKHIRIAITASLVALSAGFALAQGGGMGPGPGAGPGASAPGTGTGMGPGMRPGMGTGGGRGGPRWNADNTPGWAMMTQQERLEHRNTMLGMKSYDECKAYQEKHHAQMAERAKERGAKPLAQPRHDACAWLKR